MGRRGPPRQPTPLRLLRGNPGKRKINTNEPQPEPGIPDCPTWLGPKAKRVWDETAPVLAQMRVLTKVDRAALAAYCQTHARWQAVEEFLETNGEVYPLRDEKGAVRCLQQYPQVSIARNLLMILRGYQQEFGMTPAARTRITVAEADKQSEVEARFFGPQPAPRPKPWRGTKRD